MRLRVVTFHTSNDRWSLPHPLGGSKAPRTELVPLFVASVRATNPLASLEIITDLKTKLDGMILTECNVLQLIRRF